ncbi:MAG TPA: hypothetical protein VHN80_31340 [Kineosporiaceae bacterium]|jgi:hypothetical protein|nr:hypothetical protein [Kineosporiaceae bacterium]
MSVTAAGSVNRPNATAPSHIISPKPEPSKHRASPAQQSAFVSVKQQAAQQDQTKGAVIDVKL